MILQKIRNISYIKKLFYVGGVSKSRTAVIPKWFIMC